MKTIYQLLFFVLISHNAAYAQYGDAYHRADVEKINKDQKAYTDAYIDALRYNRNAKGKTSSQNTGNPSEAAQQLADIFAARAGRETSAQKTERLKKAEEAYEKMQEQRAINHQNYMDAARDDQARENYLLQPKVEMYASAGFQRFEAKVLGQSHVKSNLSPDKKYHIYYEVFPRRSYLAKEAFVSFNNLLNTASFEELFNLVLDFNVAPYSTLLALKKLEKRFPEKKELIEASYLLNTASFWGSVNDNTYYPAYGWADEDVKKIMFDIFYQSFVLYPKTAEMVAVKSHPDYNPLKLVAETLLKQGKYKDAFELAKQALQTPPPSNSNFDDKKYAIKAFNKFFAHPRLKSPFFTAEEIKLISENYGITVTELIEMLTDGERIYSTAYYYYGTRSFIFPVTNAGYFDKGYFKILQELGEQGNWDALNTYALGVAMGKTKENPKSAMALWQKAADAGCAFAMVNMCTASKWGLKWYSPADLALAKETLKTFKPATKSDGYILLGNSGDLKPFKE